MSQPLIQHIQLCSLIFGVLGVNSPSLIAVEAFHHQQLSHVVRVSRQCSVEVNIYNAVSIKCMFSRWGYVKAVHTINV